MPRRYYHDLNLPRSDAGNHEVLLAVNDKPPTVGDVVVISDGDEEAVGVCLGIIIVVKEARALSDAN